MLLGHKGLSHWPKPDSGQRSRGHALTVTARSAGFGLGCANILTLHAYNIINTMT